MQAKNFSNVGIDYLRENHQIFLDIATSLLPQATWNHHEVETKVRTVFLMLLKLKVETICGDQQILEFTINNPIIILHVNNFMQFQTQNNEELTMIATIFKGNATNITPKQVQGFMWDLRIENYPRTGIARNDVSIIYRLLKKHELSDQQFYKRMIKATIEKFNQPATLRDSSRESTLLTILNENKEWLAAEEPQFYQLQIRTLLNFTEHYSLVLILLINHGSSVTNEEIVNIYNNTTNRPGVVSAIENFLETEDGRNRGITLPPRRGVTIPAQRRNDVNIIQNRGVAFEVHNFTGGVEDSALLAIEKAVQELGVTTIPKFSIDDLRNKFKLLTEVEKNKCNEALNKILAASNYKEKLEKALTKLAALLNTNSPLWEHDDHRDSADERWRLWLTQSFLESAEAYASGNDHTSCVKGIYERLFTGFRSMHPLIDIMFLSTTITRDYKDNILDKIKSEELITTVIAELKAQGIKPEEKDENYFLTKLKNIYLDKLIESITQQLDKTKAELEEKLKQTLPQTMSSITPSLNEKDNQLLNKFKDKLITNIAYIGDINYTPNLGLVEYIKSQLSSVVV